MKHSIQRQLELSALRGEESDKPWFVDNQYGSTVDWISPYRDESGQVAALIGADFSVDMGSMLVDERFMITILPVAVVLLLTFAMLFWQLRRRIIAPIRMISERMEHFVEEQERQTKPLCLASEDEMQSIAEAFENMTWDIHVYIKELSRATAEQASAKAQMDAARRIQYGMVPASFHEKKDGMDVSASMEPAREVGGDFYDCFTLPDGRYCALIGDVSGKGLTVVFRDDGKAFDPLAEESTVSKDFYDLDSGGMGLGFIRALTSDASWRYENGQNVLTLRFT